MGVLGLGRGFTLMLPTLSDPVFFAMSPKVKGLQVGAEGNWFFLNNAWLER